ncbi:MAG: hypothetical protein K6E30_02360 [Lachnospiraceae bacterium]|nr:hypothetical protein [Lachnospiraceae bacterium]
MHFKDRERLLKEIEKQVRDSVENGELIILDDSAVNAYAYRKDGHNVVALTRGSIYSCLYTANLFMLSRDFFPDIGNETLFESEVKAVNYPPEISKDGDILLPTSGDEERRDVGYILAELAIRYMVYHEIGHHVLGHLEQYDEVLGLDCGEAGGPIQKVPDPDQFKMIESEADIYAAKKLMDELEGVADTWNPNFEVPLEMLELTMLMVAALVIVKENLNEELLSLQEIDDRKYTPAIIRLVVNLAVISLEKNTSLREQFRQMLAYEAEYGSGEQTTETVNDEESDLLLIETLSNVAVMSEQVYADLFVGSHDPAVFQSDFLGAEWWEHLE